MKPSDIQVGTRYYGRVNARIKRRVVGIGLPSEEMLRNGAPPEDLVATYEEPGAGGRQRMSLKAFAKWAGGAVVGGEVVTAVKPEPQPLASAALRGWMPRVRVSEDGAIVPDDIDVPIRCTIVAGAGAATFVTPQGCGEIIDSTAREIEP